MTTTGITGALKNYENERRDAIDIRFTSNLPSHLSDT
jgi:hypothetical protein